MRTILMKDGMVSMQREGGRDVLEIDRETQELWTECMPLFIIEMRSAVLVAKRKGFYRACTVTDFSSFYIPRHAMHAVMAHALFIDQLDGRAGRHMVEVIAA